jgi:hypothetical protein
MPNAFDLPYIIANLVILKDLQAEDWLSFSTATGLFSIKRKADFGWRDKAGRGLGQDPIKADPTIPIQLKWLFRAARGHYEEGTLLEDKAVGKRAVTLADIQDAFRGVETLKAIFTGPLHTLKDIEPHIRDFKLGAQGITKASMFWEKYSQECVFKVAQKMHLNPGEAGVCKAFVWDWMRRKLAIGVDKDHKPRTAKASYADSSKPIAAQTDIFDPAHLQRMTNRVSKKVRAVQAHHAHLVKNVGVTEVTLMDEMKKKFDNLFHGMSAQYVETGPKTIKLDPTNTDRGKARDFFVEAVKACAEDHAKNQAKKLSGDFEWPASGLYKIGIDNSKSSGEAHALGLHLITSPTELIHFFDPNIGEFRFPDALKNPVRFHEFLTDLWFDYKCDKYTVTYYLYSPRADQTS